MRKAQGSASRWRAVLWACLLGCAPRVAATEPRPLFEPAPLLAWQVAASDVSHRIDRHERVLEGARSSDGCEHLALVAGHGTYLYLEAPIAPAQVIDELELAVWLRADRPGLELAARVVLPRASAPASGGPTTVTVRGATYRQAGTWQRLVLHNLPEQLARQAWPLRWSRGQTVDLREAYVDRLVLNAYGGAGSSELWIDQPEVSGAVASPWVPPASKADVVLTAAAQVVPAGRKPPRIETSGSVLLVNERPLFPRLLQYRGEPLALVRQLGFNGARLSSVPTPEMLAEASRLGLWLVAPPPQPAGEGGSAAELEPFGPAWDAVLAWDLGEGLAARDSERVRYWSDAVRRADRRVSRPQLGAPEAELRSFSRQLDVLLSRRLPLGSSLELNDFGRWVRERPRLARPGTPFWTTVQTDLPAAVIEQQQALSRGRVMGLVDAEQLRVLVHTVLAGGVRGLVFESRSRLDAGDPSSGRRAAALELINLELEVLEPWLASGQVVESIAANIPDVKAAVLKSDRAHLVLPAWGNRGAQFVPGQAAGNNIALVVPGVPEATEAYEITAAGVQSVVTQRVAGGTRLVLEELGSTAIVLLTQDPLVLSTLSRRLRDAPPRAAELARQLAADKLAVAVEVDQRLARVGQTVSGAREWLADARTKLAASDAHLSRGSLREAYLEAQRAVRPLQLLERHHWERATSGLLQPVVHPLAVCFNTLPEELTWRAVAGRQVASENRLPGGDFEDLSRTMRSGWRHFQHPQTAVTSSAELSPAEPHRGQFCLRLAVAASQPQSPPALVETAPIWVTSADVPVEAGDLVRIRGWVQVPQPIQGSVDGLMVFDSLGGQALAVRLLATQGWQEIALERRVLRRGPVNVTFALCGLGEARLDDVSVEVLRPASAAPPRGMPVGRTPASIPVPGQGASARASAPGWWR